MNYFIDNPSLNLPHVNINIEFIIHLFRRIYRLNFQRLDCSEEFTERNFALSDYNQRVKMEPVKLLLHNFAKSDYMNGCKIALVKFTAPF